MNKSITELVSEKGEIIENQMDIINEEANFFKKLYTSKQDVTHIHNLENSHFFQHQVKLNENDKNSCEGFVKTDELAKALKNMGNGKSPGSDGFSVEFYKFFWKELGIFMCKSINYSYNTGQLSDFQNQGIITCIPKDGKDRRNLKNWRPISLLNVDYKIASAAIANRVKEVLPNIISETQTGFMKGRFIGDNTRLLYDIIEILEEKYQTEKLKISSCDIAVELISVTFHDINELQSNLEFH